MKKKPGKKIEKKKVDEIISDRWVFEVRMTVASMKIREGESSGEASCYLWENLFMMLEGEDISVLGIDINQLHITRKETK
jgi:hypothetical protein